MPIRSLKSAVVAIALLTVFAGSAQANQISISRIDGYYAGVGGEFTITAVDPNATAAITNIVIPNYSASTTNENGLLSFQTFCIEYTEHVNPPETDNYDVNPAGAVGGGALGPNPDPLSLGTEYLYQSFATGALAPLYNYTPGAGRQNSAAALQEAFWYLEDEITLSNPLTNVFLNLVNTNIAGGLAFAKTNTDTGNLYNVFALNLTDLSGGDRQSQLVYGNINTTTFNNVPDGGLTLMMLGAGLSGLAILRRRPL